MTIAPRPLVPRPLAAAVLAAALPIAFAAAGCGGAADPESRPAPAAAGAETPAPAGEPDGAPAAPAEAAPVNASPTAALERPAATAKRPAPKPREPRPMVVEPRSEWTIDESLPTPKDIADKKILAKFLRDDGRMVIIYRRGGKFYRRVLGKMGSLTLVEESQIEIDEDG